MKTQVHFRSRAFNCTQPRDYFINECCFGDDVCRWLIHEPRERGFHTILSSGAKVDSATWGER